MQQDTISQTIGNSYSRKGYFLRLREDCLLFLFVLCYDNKNETVGISTVITAGKRPRRYRQLGELARRHGARKLVLFGSRARGDFRERSDIDLAVYGMPPENQTSFWLDAEELPTLLKLDIVHVAPDMDSEFLSNIEKDGVILYAAES